MKPLKGLIKLFLPYRERHERRPAPEFVACHTTGSIPKEENIKDISSTGIYLLTRERWLPGTFVPLTLQRRGANEESPDRQVTLRARTVRWGQDGVGLAFALPPDLNFNLWQSVLESAADHRKTDDIIPPFRMAETLGFLSRICPSSAEELRQLVRRGLGNLRVANAVAIALNAEKMLMSERNADRMRANGKTILRIIEDGSWADEDWIRQFWEGLLAASCSLDENDLSNQIFVDCFSQLAPIHVSIFRTACAKADKVLSQAGAVSSQPLIFSSDEIQKITGSQNLAKTERDIHHLFELGLLEDSVRSRSLLPPEKIQVTPSSLGLELYARCFGYRGSPRSFYGLNPLNTEEISFPSQEL